MPDSLVPGASLRDSTLFTMNIDDKIYRCPVSVEALYVLCRDQDPSLSQIDAYLALKLKVQQVVERRLASGANTLPALLEPSDFIRS